MLFEGHIGPVNSDVAVVNSREFGKALLARIVLDTRLHRYRSCNARCSNANGQCSARIIDYYNDISILAISSRHLWVVLLHVDNVKPSLRAAVLTFPLLLSLHQIQAMSKQHLFTKHHPSAPTQAILLYQYHNLCQGIFVKLKACP